MRFFTLLHTFYLRWTKCLLLLPLLLLLCTRGGSNLTLVYLLPVRSTHLLVRLLEVLMHHLLLHLKLMLLHILSVLLLQHGSLLLILGLLLLLLLGQLLVEGLLPVVFLLGCLGQLLLQLRWVHFRVQLAIWKGWWQCWKGL